MERYIISLLAVSIIAGAIELISPEGIAGGIKKHVRTLCSICVLCVVIYPVGSFIRDIASQDSELFDNIFGQGGEGDYREVFEESLSLYSADAISQGLERLVCEEFSLDGEDIELLVYLPEQSERESVERVIVCISGKAVLCDPRQIQEYIFSLLQCESEIIYK